MQSAVGSTPIHSRLKSNQLRCAMYNDKTADACRHLIERIFVVDDITEGGHEDKYLYRFRGHLRTLDSQQAYDDLAKALKPHNITPLFRKENDQQIILLVEGVVQPSKSNGWINLGLFVLTIISVMVTGAMYGLNVPFTDDPVQTMLNIIQGGWPFAISIIAILGHMNPAIT